MARTRLDLAIALTSLVVACGSSVTVPAGSGGGDASGGAAAQGGGGGAEPQTTSTSTGPAVCQDAACGDPCTVCNDVECLQGQCDVDGSCAPFDAVTCPSGAGGGAPACPPPEEVNMGVPCSFEGQVCPSESSCSGVLDCAEGAWTLFQLC